MKKADDSHILKLFDELTDDTDWDHPRFGLHGGTIEASRALAQLAKENPERAAALAKQLRSSDQQIPALHVVRAISETEYPSSELFDLVRELVKLGFNSHDFKDSVASACDRRVGSLEGLPDDICGILKTWLCDWEFRSDASSDDEQSGESDEERERSLLFDRSGEVFTIPHGTYSILSAIAFGLIRKKPPAASAWLDVLETHLERPETTRTWQVLCRELRMLSYCDRARAVSFLKNLFAKYRIVSDSPLGVYLALTSIAMTLQRMDGRLRSAGLDLFERLLRWGFSATVQTIRELDNRPLNVSHRPRRLRRRGR